MKSQTNYKTQRYSIGCIVLPTMTHDIKLLGTAQKMRHEPDRNRQWLQACVILAMIYVPLFLVVTYGYYNGQA